MDLWKLSKLPKLLPPRKGRLSNLKRSQEELAPIEQEMATNELEKMYKDHEQGIDKLEIKILYFRTIYDFYLIKTVEIKFKNE